MGFKGIEGIEVTKGIERIDNNNIISNYTRIHPRGQVAPRLFFELAHRLVQNRVVRLRGGVRVISVSANKELIWHKA